MPEIILKYSNEVQLHSGVFSTLAYLVMMDNVISVCSENENKRELIRQG